MSDNGWVISDWKDFYDKIYDDGAYSITYLKDNNFFYLESPNYFINAYPRRSVLMPKKALARIDLCIEREYLLKMFATYSNDTWVTSREQMELGFSKIEKLKGFI